MSRSTKMLQPEMPVTIAARILLSSNLQQVQRRLKLAAKSADKDARHVHRLRISTRRSLAVLNAFKKYLPVKTRKQVAGHLKRIRHVAANARDLDVLIEQRCLDKPKDKKFIKHLRKKRKRAQQPIVKTYHRLGRNKQIEKDCRRLLKSLDRLRIADHPAYGVWAKQRMAIYVGKFFAHTPIDIASPSQLHRFRIAVKKFRYAIGVIEPAFPSRSFAKLKPQFKRLQDMLGKINDHAVAISHIRKMQAEGVDVSQNVLSREFDGLESSKQEFAKWWTRERSQAMKQRFESLTCHDPPD